LCPFGDKFRPLRVTFILCCVFGAPAHLCDMTHRYHRRRARQSVVHPYVRPQSTVHRYVKTQSVVHSSVKARFHALSCSQAVDRAAHSADIRS
jgi:hypothetical protein